MFFTLVGWWLAGKVFGLYITEIANYSATYAGLAGIVILMFFLYIQALIFLYGAEVNRSIADLRGDALTQQALRKVRVLPGASGMSDSTGQSCGRLEGCLRGRTDRSSRWLPARRRKLEALEAETRRDGAADQRPVAERSAPTATRRPVRSPCGRSPVGEIRTETDCL